MKKSFKFLVITFAFLFIYSISFADSLEKSIIRLIFDNNYFLLSNNKKVQISGIKIPNGENNTKGSCYKKKISEFMKKNILNKEIEIKNIKDGNYNFLIDGVDFRKELLKRGFAYLNEKNVELEEIQDLAKKQELGLWFGCNEQKSARKIREKFGFQSRKFRDKYKLFLEGIMKSRVKNVLSGNLFVLENDLKVKISGVSLPKNKNSASECFSQESKKFLQKKLLGQSVILKKNNVMTNAEKDYSHYFVYLDNFKPKKELFFLNEAIIITGHGKFAKEDFRDVDKIKYFEDLQNKIYKNPRGAWGKCWDLIKNLEKNDKIKVGNDCLIKGNISGTKSKPIKKYHTKLSGWYKNLQAEACFTTEDEAILAGFVKVK